MRIAARGDRRSFEGMDMKNHPRIGHALAATLLLAVAARADESLVLCDFKDEAALKA